MRLAHSLTTVAAVSPDQFEDLRRNIDPDLSDGRAEQRRPGARPPERDGIRLPSTSFRHAAPNAGSREP
jgi:hypothetical protein